MDHTLGWDVELKNQMKRNELGSDMLGTELLTMVLDVASSVDEGLNQETRRLLSSFFGVRDVEKNGAVVLGALRLRNQHRTATDPRDKINGLLGLAKKFRGDHAWQLLAAHYSESVELVFHEFTEFLLDNSNSLGELSLVERSPKDGLRNVPSWTPKFALSRVTEPLIIHECHNASSE